jgi:hypothetical protein
LDFLKLLRSFEDFIFEAVTWLVFYPLTVWKIVARPLTTMAYSDAEQQDSEEKRYDDALSPPLLLLVTVVVVNAIAALLHTEDIRVTSKVTAVLFASPQNLALFRALVFSLVPLVAAVTLIRRTGTRLSRETLRPPFYAQCYLATPCCIVLGLGVTIFHRPDLPDGLGAALLVAGSTWFLVTQTRWFRSRLNVSWGNAAWTTVWALVRATIYLFLLLIPVAFI